MNAMVVQRVIEDFSMTAGFSDMEAVVIDLIKDRCVARTVRKVFLLSRFRCGEHSCRRAVVYRGGRFGDLPWRLVSRAEDCRPWKRIRLVFEEAEASVDKETEWYREWFESDREGFRLQIFEPLFHERVVKIVLDVRKVFVPDGFIVSNDLVSITNWSDRWKCEEWERNA